MKKLCAEMFGTFALVFAGTGAIIINQASTGAITHVGIALTFGLVILAMIYTRSFYGLTAAFHKLTMPKHLRPMIGALLTGIVGLAIYYGLKSTLPASSHSWPRR